MIKNLLPLGLLSLLTMGCAKQSVEPGSLATSQSPQAGLVPDFYSSATADSPATFARYYTRDGEFHFARVFYTRDGEFHLDRLSVVADDASKGNPVIEFEPAADGRTQVAVLNGKGQAIYTVTPANGALVADLSKVVVQSGATYTLQVTNASGVASQLLTVVE